MDKFHVACGGNAIIAGVLNEAGDGWAESEEVTEEVLCAVRDWFVNMKPDEAEQIGFRWKKKDGGSLSIVLVDSDEDEDEPEELETEQ